MYFLRLRPDSSIFDQLLEENIYDSSTYQEKIAETVKEQAQAQHRLGRIDDGQLMDIQDSIRQGRNAQGLETALSKSVLKRIRSESLIETLVGSDAVLLDFPDFSRTDRRPLLRALNEVQDLWVRVLREGAAYDGMPLGPNFIITMQKELLDLAPSYFLGKTNVVELKGLSAEQFIYAYRAKFQTCDPFDEAALDYLVHLSRSVFRRFLKFLAGLLHYAESANLRRVTLRDALGAVTPAQVSQEMETELAYIFPKPDMREKGSKIIMALLQAKYQPPVLERFFESNSAKQTDELGLPVESGPTQKELADMLSLTEVDVSRLVNRLVAHGLVTRERVLVGKDEHMFDVTRTIVRLNM